MLKGNKGEWSEIYVFLRLLLDRKVFCIDQDLTVGDDYLEILELYRKMKDGNLIVYDLKDEIGKFYPEMDKKDVKNLNNTSIEYYCRMILHKLASKTDRTFELEDVEKFLSLISIDTLKAKSTDKTDIQMLTRDPKNTIISRNGFSIKSDMGAKATLINSSGATNFVFKLEGFNFDKMQRANEIESQNERMGYIFDNISNYTFCGADSIQTKSNLQLLDFNYEKIISLLLWKSFELGITDLKKLCLHLDKQNYFNISDNYFEFKIKKLLITCCLGLNLGQKWSRKEDANGGFINVSKDGQLSAIHFFNRNIVEDFLFDNTKLERGSRTKHKYGDVYQKNNEFYIKLNFAVRFK